MIKKKGKKKLLCNHNHQFTWQMLHLMSAAADNADGNASKMEFFVFLRQFIISSSFKPVLTYPILSPSSSNSCFADKRSQIPSFAWGGGNEIVKRPKLFYQRTISLKTKGSSALSVTKEDCQITMSLFILS